MGNKGRFAIVVARYGLEVLGGAETLARLMAEAMRADGYDIHVFTTCARDHFTWKNYYAPQTTEVNGVPVHRFEINVDWSPKSNQAYSERISRHEPLTVSEQFAWVDGLPHSGALYKELWHQRDDFEFFFFIPYISAISYYGTALLAEKSILIPCLHDEVYAYLAPTRLMLQTVKGLSFNAEPEQWLTERKVGILNAGARTLAVGIPRQVGDPKRGRAVVGFDEPFLLYSGRLEGAKNVPLLIDYFIRYKSRHSNDLRLVLTGSGHERLKQSPDIVPVGFLSDGSKYDVMAAAMMFCQPSVNESFSIVIMEAWHAAIPVIVNAACAVTRYHVTQSGGGLYFADYQEFEEILDLLQENHVLARQMGRAGRRYVQSRYNWQTILDGYRDSIDFWRTL